MRTGVYAHICGYEGQVWGDLWEDFLIASFGQFGDQVDNAKGERCEEKCEGEDEAADSETLHRAGDCGDEAEIVVGDVEGALRGEAREGGDCKPRGIQRILRASPALV